VKKTIISTFSVLLAIISYCLGTPLWAEVTMIAAMQQPIKTPYAVVDLVGHRRDPGGEGSFKSCPEAPYTKTGSRQCFWRGVVNGITLEHGKTFSICRSNLSDEIETPEKSVLYNNPDCPVRVMETRGGRITVSLDGESFFFLIKSRESGELSSAMSLFTASKIHNIPITVSFENWGGKFYIYDVEL
jgi:hypothetical protein